MAANSIAKKNEEKTCYSPSLTCRSKIEVKIGDTYCLLVSRDDNLIYTGHHGHVNLWRCSHVSGDSRPTWSLQKTISTPVSGDVTSVCEVFNKENLLVIAVDTSIVFYNQRNLDKPVQLINFNKEEVNQLDVHAKGDLICACDDSGEIKVIDVNSFTVHKTLQGHDNICSTVKFVARKPWELISGGLDYRLIRWDFNRGRPLSVLNQVELVSRMNDDSSENNGSCCINPPMIHSMDIFSSTSTVVCGLGNGMIAAYGLKSGKEMNLLCMEAFHCTSIGCICCVEVPRKQTKTTDKYYIVSGGNDGKICVIEFKEEESSKGATAQSRKTNCQLILFFEWNNGSKINWIRATVQVLNGIEASKQQMLRVFVADQTSFISVYECSVSCV